MLVLVSITASDVGAVPVFLYSIVVWQLPFLYSFKNYSLFLFTVEFSITYYVTNYFVYIKFD